MARSRSGNWPVLTSYRQDSLRRIALPLGGIGTGSVCLGGRGNLHDWAIVNRPAQGFSPRYSFFALYAKRAGAKPVCKVLEGPIDAADYDGATGCAIDRGGFPRFRRCRFRSAYPLGQVLLSDPAVPVNVRLEAFNPLVPADIDTSGVPVAVLRFVLTNKTAGWVATTVCASMQNFIGADGTIDIASRNYNIFRKPSKSNGIQGIFMGSAGVNPQAEQFGTMALVTTAKSEISYRTAWSPKDRWRSGVLDFWDDLLSDGRLDESNLKDEDTPIGSLAVSVRVPPRGQREVTYLLTWHFPNRQTWTPADNPKGADDGQTRVGNYYTTRYVDAWDVAVSTAGNLQELESNTLTFVRSFCQSDLPAPVKEAALYNLSVLRTQTCFMTEDGNFLGWEGIRDKPDHDGETGCCHGSCTHVWNYEQATAFLFGDLAARMRRIEFLHATDERGLMSFRVNLPLRCASQYPSAAADGQMGCLMKLYRDWQLSGDDRLLCSLWTKARKALEFCWIPGGWDADQDGVMEGCQHNTMDVEYYGPNPQMAGWYLGALRAVEEMSRYLGDSDFADHCRKLFERGKVWIDANLFNGQYYEHHIRPAKDASELADGLRHGLGAEDVEHPDFQLGAGCLADQLVGQYMAHICGLGYLLDPSHIRTTLANVMKYNYKSGFFDHFNHERSFVLNDESGLLMATYPKGRRPQTPFACHSEVMTGFEYTAAAHMLYEGQTSNGLKIIESVRARYDGKKRNPFDEPECGRHYARAMASWAAILALTGFRYSAVERSIDFAYSKTPARWFWSSGYAWGTLSQRPTAGHSSVALKVLGGKIVLDRCALAGFGSVTLANTKTLFAGDVLRVRVRPRR